jgi:restriction endonuclease S subunit
MKTTLGHITTIQTGLFAKPVLLGEVIYLQAKHFDENGKLTSELHPDLVYENSIKKHLLVSGDILFAAKGSKNFATVFQSDYPASVASTSFFVIRIMQTTIISADYLAWFLNQPNTQKFLKGNAIGTGIVSISKAVLNDLEILIPSIEKQKIILDITDLHHLEKNLRVKIETLKEKQIQHQIHKALEI